MNRFLRMAYGHSGTRSRRILVSVPPGESDSTPRWARLLLLVVWFVVPVLVSLYAIPKTTQQMRTVIDISKLAVTPPPEQERPVIHEPERIPPIKQQAPPTPEAQTEQKPLVQPRLAPPAEVKPPAITRPTRERLPESVENQPRISRERLRTGTEAASPAVPRIRREAVVNEAREATTSITRTRGATGADAPPGKEHVAPLRRAPVTQGQTTEGETTQRTITRKERTSGSPVATEVGRLRIDATRERKPVPVPGTGGADASIGIARGITLASLGICSSPQQEEDDIKAVLSVIGSRQSCTDEKGEFQFKATKRISSFNLIIFPAKGRRPSNRCEELKNAYKCLKIN